MTPPYPPAHPAAHQGQQSLDTLVKIIYGLYVASLFMGLTSIIGVIMAHVKRGDSIGTIYESHFTNQIRTFWIGLFLSIIGGIATIILIGWLILFGTYVWVLYRTIKGFLRVNDGRAYD